MPIPRTGRTAVLTPPNDMLVSGHIPAYAGRRARQQTGLTLRGISSAASFGKAVVSGEKRLTKNPGSVVSETAGHHKSTSAGPVPEAPGTGPDLVKWFPLPPPDRKYRRKLRAGHTCRAGCPIHYPGPVHCADRKQSCGSGSVTAHSGTSSGQRLPSNSLRQGRRPCRLRSILPESGSPVFPVR